MTSAPTPPPALRLAPADNVAVTVRQVLPGEAITVDGVGVVASETIPLGHKIALAAIPAEGEVVKFGMPIGLATEPIPAGAWVHIHNIRSRYINNDVDHHEV